MAYEAEERERRQKLAGAIQAAKDTHAFTGLHKMIFWDHEIQGYTTVDRDDYWSKQTTNYNLMDLAWSTATQDRMDVGIGAKHAAVSAN